MKPERRPLTDEEKAECAAFKREFIAWNEARPKSERVTQEQAGSHLGMNQGSFSNYLNGHRALHRDIAIGIYELLGISVAKYSKRLAEEITRIAQAAGTEQIQGKESNVINADFSKKSRDGDISIPHHDVRAAMGEGQILPSDYIETIRHVTVSLDYLRTQGVSFTKPENLGMITGFGESMNKTFASGDPLMIDRGVTTLQTDGVYMFTLSGALFVKRLQMLPNGVRVISDNDAYPPYDITGSDLKGMVIHARVLLAWRSQRL